jgi:hypothetical protein
MVAMPTIPLVHICFDTVHYGETSRVEPEGRQSSTLRHQFSYVSVPPYLQKRGGLLSVFDKDRERTASCARGSLGRIAVEHLEAQNANHISLIVVGQGVDSGHHTSAFESLHVQAEVPGFHPVRVSVVCGDAHPMGKMDRVQHVPSNGTRDGEGV